MSELIHDPDCGWPFMCHIEECACCKMWEEKYSQNIDDWLKQKAEIQAAARADQAAKRRTMRAGGSA